MSLHSDLLRQLHPDIHAKESGSVFFKWTEALGKTFQDLSDALDDVKANLFVLTATWKLPYWEELLQIGTNETLTDQQRRARIIARLTATGITVGAMQQVTEQFIGVTPVVIEWFSRGFRADISRAGDPCIETDDMFLFEVIVPKTVDTNSYSHDDLEDALNYHKPGHTTVIVTHPEDFTLTLTDPTTQDVVMGTPTTFGLDVASLRMGTLDFTATVTTPTGYEYAITDFTPSSQRFDSSPGSATFTWTPPTVGSSTPYTIIVEAWGENGGYETATYSGNITTS